MFGTTLLTERYTKKLRVSSISRATTSRKLITPADFHIRMLKFALYYE